MKNNVKMQFSCPYCHEWQNSSFSEVNYDGVKDEYFNVTKCKHCKREIIAIFSLEFEEFATPQYKEPDIFIKVDSSFIDEVAYDYENEVLFIRMKSHGDTYQYYNVDPKTYCEFLSAPSKGEFYSEKIKKGIL
jgi:hypothetical protein